MTSASGGLGSPYIAQGVQHEPLDQIDLKDDVDATLRRWWRNIPEADEREPQLGPSGMGCVRGYGVQEDPSPTFPACSHLFAKEVATEATRRQRFLVSRKQEEWVQDNPHNVGHVFVCVKWQEKIKDSLPGVTDISRKRNKEADGVRISIVSP